MNDNIIKRIHKELSSLCQEPKADFWAEQTDPNDPFYWQATIKGPDGSLYQGGLFRLDVRFPIDYPWRPPRLNFTTKIYHPNINQNGAMSLDVLKDQWSPALTISKLLQTISQLMAEPNPDDPLEPEIAMLYKRDIEQFDKNVKEWIMKYAQ